MSKKKNNFIRQHFEVGSIQELIHRRRRQIAVHSCIYYRMGGGRIDDQTFDKWAYELADLQRKYPKESNEVLFMQEEFKEFDGKTGYHLIDEPSVVGTALRLNEIKD